MTKPNFVLSFYLKCVIQIQRVIDHAWNRLFGLPQAKRSMITPQLYLGGQYALRGINDMKKLGITSIVSMRMTSPRADNLTGFKVLHLPTVDMTPPALEDLHKGVVFIKNEIDNKGKVYIHCHHGEGRGPSMVIAYLISTGLTYDDAHMLVKKVRTFINLNLPQVARLQEFEQSL
ncbi:MAG: dual specificity protein phosphatase family protein [bacterium]|nr:dual specificity protein phosphatase family protein [bacterium]